MGAMMTCRAWMAMKTAGAKIPHSRRMCLRKCLSPQSRTRNWYTGASVRTSHPEYATSAAVITPPTIQLAVVLTRFPEVSSASVVERNAGKTLPSAHVQDAPAVDQSASLLHGATRMPTAGSDERWPKPVLRRGVIRPAHERDLANLFMREGRGSGPPRMWATTGAGVGWRGRVEPAVGLEPTTC